MLLPQMVSRLEVMMDPLEELRDSHRAYLSRPYPFTDCPSLVDTNELPARAPFVLVLNEEQRQSLYELACISDAGLFAPMDKLMAPNKSLDEQVVRKLTSALVVGDLDAIIRSTS